METVTSKDGTRIAFDRLGDGPPVILVSGATADRQSNAGLAGELAAHFTVLNYDRRGRGDSSDTSPHALTREFEDLEALIAAAGGSAHLYGISSGGALALEATAAGLQVGRLAVYEVPYNLDDDQPRIQQEYVDGLEKARASGVPGAMFEVFMRQVASADDEMLAGFRETPMWADMVAVEKTLPYDAAALGTGQPPVGRLATIDRPTCVLTGDAETEKRDVGTKEFFEAAARAIADAVPGAQLRILPEQAHMVAPEVLAPALTEFFQAG